MAGNPFFWNLDPQGAPDAVTPSDGPSDPAGYAGVTPPGTGAAPAPYDIAAPQDIAGFTAALDGAAAVAGAGVLYPAGPRQAEARAILESPQGAESSNVFAGFPDYENQDLRPGANLETPIQGQGGYPVGNTYQPGIPQFTAGLGAGAVLGVPPDSGAMGASKGGDYPGTTQPGVPQSGTS